MKNIQKKKLVVENTCRICGDSFDDDSGEKILSICNNCAGDYDLDAIYDDIENGVISKKNLKTFDIDDYLYDDEYGDEFDDFIDE